MLRLSIFLSLAVTLLLVPACKKKEDKWKIPTTVKFKMDINRGSSLGGNLVFDGGDLMVGSFTFEGKRDQGDDVYFSNSYSGLDIPFDQNSQSPDLVFDIPQGSYSQIKISYKTFGTPGDKHINVTGYYKHSNGTTYPVVFEYKSERMYHIIARSSKGGERIVLEKDVEANALIKLDPVYWSQDITGTMMENATFTSVNGVPTILINNSTNHAINNAIKGRMNDDESEVIFN